MLTYERAAELLAYDPETGSLTWRVGRARTAKQGALAGTPNPAGYLRVKVDGRSHMAHRLAWLLVYGEWPAGSLDHINGQRNDNRLCNLRLADNATNQFNASAHRDSTSGVKNVAWHKQTGLWQVRVQARGINHCFGRFSDLVAATEAARAARAALHGEFVRHD